MDTTTISQTALTGAPVDGTVATQPVNADQRAQIQAVKAAVKTLNDANQDHKFGPDNELTFFLDRASRQAVVRIVNRDTGEVVQQIPNKQVLRMAEEYSGG